MSKLAATSNMATTPNVPDEPDHPIYDFSNFQVITPSGEAVVMKTISDVPNDTILNGIPFVPLTRSKKSGVLNTSKKQPSSSMPISNNDSNISSSGELIMHDKGLLSNSESSFTAINEPNESCKKDSVNTKHGSLKKSTIAEESDGSWVNYYMDPNKEPSPLKSEPSNPLTDSGNHQAENLLVTTSQDVSDDSNATPKAVVTSPSSMSVQSTNSLLCQRSKLNPGTSDFKRKYSSLIFRSLKKDKNALKEFEVIAGTAFNPAIHGFVKYRVRKIIVDSKNENDGLNKIALTRPPSEVDHRCQVTLERLFDVFNDMSSISKEQLVLGNCYLVKHGERVYRGIYTAVRDDACGVFDFGDYDFMHNIPFSDVRKLPVNLAELHGSFQTTWVYTNTVDFRRK